jgi:hypothetical protein
MSGLACDLDQGLWPRVGQWAHALAIACGQHHGRGADLRHERFSRMCAGRWRSNHALSFKRRMREIAFEIARDARDMLQIAVLAVALREPREDAEDLGGALCAEDRIGGIEDARSK